MHSLEELRTFSSQVSPQQRRKRHLADALPTLPGVYLFRDARGRVLYVGRTRHLRSRVGSYWGDLRDRRHLRRMVARVARVEALTEAITRPTPSAPVVVSAAEPPAVRRQRTPEEFQATVSAEPRYDPKMERARA